MIKFNFLKIPVELSYWIIPAVFLFDIYFLLLVMLFFHEIGHALVAKFYYGLNVEKICIYPICGYTKLNKFSNNIKENIIIILAGPVVDLIFAYCFLGLFYLTHYEIFYSIAFCSFIFIFNLMPIAPFDGFHVVTGLLSLFKINSVFVDFAVHTASSMISICLFGINEEYYVIILILIFNFLGYIFILNKYLRKKEITKKINFISNEFFHNTRSLSQRLKDYTRITNKSLIIKILNDLHNKNPEIDRLIDYYCLTLDKIDPVFVESCLWDDVCKTFYLFRKEKFRYDLYKNFECLAHTLYPEDVAKTSLSFTDMPYVKDYNIEKYKGFFFRNEDVDLFIELFFDKNKILQEALEDVVNYDALECIFIVKTNEVLSTIGNKIIGVINKFDKNDQLLIKQILMILIIDNQTERI